MTARDGAERGLRFAVALLPVRRRGWGEAMLAELAAVEGRRPRRRFAVSCARGVLGDAATLGSLVGRLAVAGTAVAVAVLAGSAAPLVTVEAGATLIGAVLLGMAGRQPTPLGPVSGIPRASGLRLVGFLLVGGLLAWFLTPAAGGARHDPAGWWVAGVSALAYLTATLSMTAERTATRGLLRTVGVVSIASTALWWVSVLLLGGLREAGWWPLLLAAGAGAAAAVLAGSGRDRTLAGTGSAAVTALLVFLSAAAAYTAGSAGADQMYQGGPPPAPVGLIPTVDPYIAVLLAGALPAVAVALLAGARALKSGRRASGPEHAAMVAAAPS